VPEPLDDVELERLMLETRALVDSLRAGGAMPAGEQVVRGEGAASGERIRATVLAGHVESKTLDPRLMRLPPEEFGELVRDAVNAALTDLSDKSGAAEAAPDLAALSETLRQVQNEGLRQLGVISQGIADAMARIGEHTQISGDPSPHGLEQLLDLAQRNLDDALDAAGDPGDVRGEGEARRGQIRAVAVLGRVESVTVERQAMRMASHEMADELRTAMNAALEDLRSNAGGRATADRGDPGDLTKRVREVQDMSLEQMRTYTRALRDIMGSIGEPE
jgi:hypothetical protein